MDDPELAAAIAASLLDADPAAGDALDAGSAATGDSGAGGGFAVAMATDDVKGAAGAREALMQLKGALSLTAAGERISPSANRFKNNKIESIRSTVLFIF